MGNTTVEMYVSFIDEDRDFYHHLQAHLSPLEGQGRIHLTSGDDILPGDDEQATRKALLKRTSILVLLVSPMYLQSDQHAHEVAFAMHQHEAKKARVVPILLKPCAYEEAPFAGLQILPRNEKPITRWGDRDAAFLDITNELKTLLKEFPLRASSEGLASLWTVPYPRNSLFTGREAELHAIETTLRQGQPAAIGQTQAISGLGGIGKTQIALEYAYRHRHDYRYIFWVLADTRDTLNADYSKLAACQGKTRKRFAISSRPLKAGWRKTRTGCSFWIMPMT